MALVESRSLGTVESCRNFRFERPVGKIPLLEAGALSKGLA
jgi:hypothetical protein